MDLTIGGRVHEPSAFVPPLPRWLRASGETPQPVESAPVPRQNLRVSAEMAAIASYEESERFNHVLNVVIAAIALVLLSPVMLLVALIVRLTSKGPVMYTQTRVGIDQRRRRTRPTADDRRKRDFGGKVFTIYKFRSMFVDAEQRTGAVWASKHDPRVTPFGRIMRKTRLDELPQLVNVLKGDMNIVGPRPERPSIFVQLRTDIEEYPVRQRVKPGITGWAQINHAYDTCLDDVKRKLHFDLEYMRRRSMGEDLKIMALTVPTMVLRKGGW